MSNIDDEQLLLHAPHLVQALLAGHNSRPFPCEEPAADVAMLHVAHVSTLHVVLAT